MEGLEFEGFHLWCRNFDSAFVCLTIQICPSLRPGNEIDGGAIVRQRLTSPVHRDEGEQAMLDLVPLARAGRKVTHRNRQSLFRCEGLQLSLPPLSAQIGGL